MKAVDHEKFKISIAKELYNVYDNNIYEVIKKTDVREGHYIPRSVWYHRRKTTPDSVIYRHRSRLCADGSTQNFGIDYNENYSPVVMWSTLRARISYIQRHLGHQPTYMTTYRRPFCA